MADIDGVPVPYIVQAGHTLGGLVQKMEEQGATPEIVGELHRTAATFEQAYPGSPSWEKYREQGAGFLARHAGLDAALRFLAEGESLHNLVDVGFTLIGADDSEDHSDTADLFSMLLDMVEKEKVPELTRAFVDILIEIDPFASYIDTYEELLRSPTLLRLRPSFRDPLMSWAEAQQKRRPKIDWIRLTNGVIKDDSMWAGAPVRFRQFAMSRFYELRERATRQLTPESVQNALTFFAESFETPYPDASIWDESKTMLGIALLEADEPGLARMVGHSMRNSQHQADLIARLFYHGSEEDALQLALTLNDPELMATVLLDGEWTEDRGLKMLGRIVDDPDGEYPIDRRIGALEVMRNRCIIGGEAEHAQLFEEKIAELRREGQRPDRA